MRRNLYGPIASLILLLAGSAMAADGPPEPSEPAAQTELREQANRLVKEGRLADARDIHLSLWRISGRPGRAFNVGMLSHRIRDYPTAAEYLTLWFDLVGPLNAPKIPIPPADLPSHTRQYERARIDLEEARKHVGAIEVHVSDPGAEVLVDDRRVGVSPLKFPVFVSPGRHRIVAQLGGARAEEAVAVEAGGERTARLVLAVAPTAAPAPPLPSPPRAGKAWGPANPWLIGTGASAAVTLIATGIGFHVAGGDAEEDAQAEKKSAAVLSRSDAEYRRAYDAATEHHARANTMHDLGSAALIAGATIAAATVVYVTLPRDAKIGVRVGGAEVTFSW